MIFLQIIQTGSLATDSTKDWTVKVDVKNLTQGTTYYYRFRDEQNRYSVIGRMKTAPSGNQSDLKFAVTSCSSVFSGFFNAYRRIGARDDLNLVIHLGDCVYDFIDGNEAVRVPSPYAQPPQNLAEWRDRHEYYLLDPDLRYVRQQHPFALLWDNHDMAFSDKNVPLQAFMEWTPMRQIDSADFKKIYRKLSYGDLADIFILDVMLYRDVELIDSNEYSILGTEQYNWFLNELGASTAKWKIIGSQKMFSYWGAQSLGAIIPTPGGVLNVATWDGYMLERKNVLDFIDANDIDNVIIITGDSHVSMAADLTRDPTGTNGEYNPLTGEGALGVELLPTSISRGNFDELGLPQLLLDALYSLSAQENPHHLYEELVEHGYGIWHLQRDSAIAQIWYNDILQQTNNEELGAEYIVYDGVNHYKRPGQQFPVDTVSSVEKLPEGYFISQPYPNPAGDEVMIDFSFSTNEQLSVQIYQTQLLSKLKLSRSMELSMYQKGTMRISIGDLPVGSYVVYIIGRQLEATRIFVKQ